MTMFLEVNGAQYDNFIAASCEIRLDALCNTFSFEAAAAEGEALPFKGGEACRIYVNNRLVLTGFIEIVQVAYSTTEHVISIQGRDKTCDLLDSSINKISDLKAPISLKQIIEKVISDIGVDITVIDNASPELFEQTQDVIAPEPGENAFEFIEKYSRKRQVLLSSNGEGNIVITKSNPVQGAGAIQHIIGADDNNVISANFNFDTTQRYNKYAFASQLNPLALVAAGSIGLDTVVNQGGGVTDSDIRPGRQLVIIAESSFSDDQNEARAKWEANIRKARGLVYSAVVSGFTVDASNTDSALWEINTLYQIVDEYIGKIEPMLCNSVIFTLDTDAGAQTTLGFVDSQSYTLTLTKPRTNQTASLVI